MDNHCNCEYCNRRIFHRDLESHLSGKKHCARVADGLQSEPIKPHVEQGDHRAAVYQKQDILLNSLFEPWLSNFDGCIKRHVSKYTSSETIVQLQELFLLFPCDLHRLDCLYIVMDNDFAVIVLLLYQALVLEEPWRHMHLAVNVKKHILQLIEQHLQLTDMIKSSALNLSSKHFSVVIYKFFKLAPNVQSPESTLSYMEKEISKWIAYEEMLTMENDIDKLQDRIIENYEKNAIEHIDTYVEAKSSFQQHTSN